MPAQIPVRYAPTMTDELSTPTEETAEGSTSSGETAEGSTSSGETAEGSTSSGETEQGSTPSGQTAEEAVLGAFVAKHFTQLCEQRSGQPSLAVGLWSFLGYQVSFNEALEISLSGFWRLDSDELLKTTVPTEDLELIPIPPIEKSKPGANQATLTSIHGQREIEPVPSNSMAGLVQDRPGAWRNYLALPMTRSEYATFPVVKLTSVLPNRRDKTKFRRLHRQLLPVGKIEIRFDVPSDIRSLEISAPEFSTIDWVALQYELDLSGHVEDIEGCVNLVMASTNSAELGPILKTNVDEILARLAGDLQFLVKEVHRVDIQAKESTSSALPEQDWSADLQGLMTMIEQWRESYPDPNCSFDDLKKELKIWLRPCGQHRSNFSILHK